MAMEPLPHDYITYECGTHINAPPERVFGIVGDLSKANEWAGSGQVESIEKTTEGPVSVGTKYVAQEKIGMRFKAESQITAYEPNRLIVWKAWPIGAKSPDGRGHRWSFELTPENGGTRLVHKLRAARAPFPMRILQLPLAIPAMKKGMLRGIDRTLDNVKKRAERPSTPESSLLS